MNNSANTNRTYDLATTFAIAAALAPIITATVDLLDVPAAVHQGRLPALAAMLARSLVGVYQLLWPLALYQVALATLYAMGHGLEADPRKLRSMLCILMSGGAALWIYTGLSSYQPFAGYPPFIALFALLAVATAATTSLAPHVAGPHSPVRIVWLARAGTMALLLGATAVYALEKLLFVGHYPTLHLAAVRTGQLLLQLGIGLALMLAAPPRSWLSRVVWTTILALVLASPAFISGAGSWDGTAADHARHTTLGRALALRNRDVDTSKGARKIALSRERSLSLFADANGLPELPADFELSRYNVLLITWEAARFDQTSLADPASGVTPGLLELEKRGAFSFSRAYSTASITLQSIAALLTMTFPSATALDVGAKSWDGTLRPEAETLAEIFSSSGYDTFWIGHNRNGCFTDVIHGYQQGFDRVQLFLEHKSDRSLSTEFANPEARDRPVDEQIVDELRREIERRAPSRRRFFGWTFLVSPHAEYLAHYPDRPRRTELERYRQELSYADSQTSRILDHLHESGLDQQTIVVIVGDHGEEFGEHGGRFHGSTLLDEQIHIPLLVRLPGVSGRRISSPTSPTYVFPWLLLRGDPAMRSTAIARIHNDIAPAIHAAGGGVPMEILSRDKMQAGLVLGHQKIVKHLISGSFELFDLETDPGERHNLIGSHPRAQRLTELLERYLESRRETRQYKLVE